MEDHSIWLNALTQLALRSIAEAENDQQLEQIRVALLGSNGIFNEIFKNLFKRNQ